MAERRPWTEEDQREAEELRAQGLGYKAIGKKLGRQGCTIQRHLNPETAEKVRDYARARHWADREASLARMKDRYAADPERHRERARRWHQENLEKARERLRLYQRSHKAEKLQRERLWRKENPEAAKERVRQRRDRKRAANRAALVPLGRQGWSRRRELFGDRCAYCGAEGSLTVDHVLALTAGGLDEPSNIVPACHSCNSSKNASPVEAWYRRQEFFKEARWARIQRHCPGAASGQLPLSLVAA